VRVVELLVHGVVDAAHHAVREADDELVRAALAHVEAGQLGLLEGDEALGRVLVEVEDVEEEERPFGGDHHDFEFVVELDEFDRVVKDLAHPTEMQTLLSEHIHAHESVVISAGEDAAAVALVLGRLAHARALAVERGVADHVLLVLEVLDADGALLVHGHDAVALVDGEHVHGGAAVVGLHDVLLGAVEGNLDQLALGVLDQPVVLSLGHVDDHCVHLEGGLQIDGLDLALVGFDVVHLFLTPELDLAVLARTHDLGVVEEDVVHLTVVAGQLALPVRLHDACLYQHALPEQQVALLGAADHLAVVHLLEAVDI